VDKIEFLCGLPMDSTVHRTKGDGSSKLTFDVPEIYLHESNTLVEQYREKPLKVTVEVVE